MLRPLQMIDGIIRIISIASPLRKLRSLWRMPVAAGAHVVLLMLFASTAGAGEARQLWQQDWDKTVAAAKAEGQVTVYVHSTYGPVLSSGAFEKAFPGIKLTMVSGVENDLERRFTSERRAGKFLADVFMVGVLRSYDFMQAKFLDPIKPRVGVARSGRRVEMVARQAPLQRSRA